LNMDHIKLTVFKSPQGRPFPVEYGRSNYRIISKGQ
jgi:hypothetical protein